MPLATGDRLGPYEILARIGAGGMGEVWKARDTRLDRVVAIKVSQEKFSERFEREARAVAALNHPHICTLHDVGPNYLVMEYIEGQPLKGPLPLDQVLKYGAQICDALDAAHKKGVVHRDLKPGNILLAKAGVKLLDFGLARIETGPNGPTLTDSMLTRAGEVMGTPAYMAPEQWEGRPGDSRSDIYAFGCVLHEMITGRRITPERLAVEPPVLESVLRTCLERDPDDRWQSARDLRRALQLPVTLVSTPAKGSWRERLTWPALFVATVSLLLVLFTQIRTSPTPVSGDVARLSVNPPENTRLTGVASSTVSVPNFAVSPDGRAIVLTAAGRGATPKLWLRRLEEVEARPLAGTEDAQYPFWSPRGDWLGFFAQGRLKKIRATGGPVQDIADSVPDPRGGSWGSDDTILFGTGSDAILRVAATGSTAAAVTRFDKSRGDGSHRWPVWLPDERHFIFTVRSSLPDQSGVFIGSLEGDLRRLPIRWDGNVAYSPGYILFLDGSTLLAYPFDEQRLEVHGQPLPIAERVGVSSVGLGAFSASTAGTLAYSGVLSQAGILRWFDRNGNPLDSVGDVGDYPDFRLSPDEKLLAASLVDSKTGNPDVWMFDLVRGGKSLFTFGPRLNASPVWSPDGGAVAFRTTRNGGTAELYRKNSNSDGNGDPLLRAAALRAAGVQMTNVVITDWSPDGQDLLFVLTSTAGSDLWRLPITINAKPVPFLRSSADKLQGNFSPGGKLVVFSSNASGRFDVLAQTFPTPGRTWSVSTDGGYEPRFRADGREIYYLSEDGKLLAVAVGPGPTFGVPKLLFQTQVPESVGFNRSHYVPSRDGQRFLINTRIADTAPASITVVLNWTAGLKRN